MPEPLTLGHLMALVAALLVLWGLWHAFTWWRHRAHGRGTPGYARARDGRRYAAWSIAAAFILLLLACLTPLGDVALS